VEGLEQYRVLGEERYTADCLQGLACAAAIAGRPLRAARLWGAAEALLESIDAPLSPADHAFQEPFRERAQAAAPDDEWEAAFREGRMDSLEHAVAYGRDTSTVSVGDPVAAPLLTPSVRRLRDVTSARRRRGILRADVREEAHTATSPQ
jgi:hypothetical protein